MTRAHHNEFRGICLAHQCRVAFQMPQGIHDAGIIVNGRGFPAGDGDVIIRVRDTGVFKDVRRGEIMPRAYLLKKCLNRRESGTELIFVQVGFIRGNPGFCGSAGCSQSPCFADTI